MRQSEARRLYDQVAEVSRFFRFVGKPGIAPLRALVPGTLEVYPIANYGAVEIGVHRFHHPGHDDTEGVGEAKSNKPMQGTNGSWKVTGS